MNSKEDGPPSADGSRGGASERGPSIDADDAGIEPSEAVTSNKVYGHDALESFSIRPLSSVRSFALIVVLSERPCFHLCPLNRLWWHARRELAK